MGWNSFKPLTVVSGKKITILRKRQISPRCLQWLSRNQFRIQLYSYFEKGCRKNVHATTPKGNVGYDQYTVPHDCSCRTYFCCFPLALANICPWPLVPFFQISLENRADKTTHNTFRDCRVHFFRQPFSKQLYTAPEDSKPAWLATESR